MENHEEPALFASMPKFLLCLVVSFVYYIIFHARARSSMQTIVAESTTLRRHIEAKHSVSVNI